MMRVELVGGLGCGKSTLCLALEKIGFNTIYETLETNPFLADCFADPENFRFPSQMWFAVSKFHEIRKFERADRINILDQSVLNVRAYTHLLFKNEDADALDIINRCFAYLELKLGLPDLLINLQCSPEEQLRRIRMRNRAHEAGVTLTYISDLQYEIDQLLALAKASGVPTLNIDTQKIYLPNNFSYAEELSRQISVIFNLDFERLQAVQPKQYSFAEK